MQSWLLLPRNDLCFSDQLASKATFSRYKKNVQMYESPIHKFVMVSLESGTEMG